MSSVASSLSDLSSSKLNLHQILDPEICDNCVCNSDCDQEDDTKCFKNIFSCCVILCFWICPLATVNLICIGWDIKLLSWAFLSSFCLVRTQDSWLQWWHIRSQGTTGIIFLYQKQTLKLLFCIATISYKTDLDQYS